MALRTPEIRDVCQDILVEMSALLRYDPATGGNLADAKNATALEYEKLIWALLLADKFTYVSEEAAQLQDQTIMSAAPAGSSGAGAAGLSRVAQTRQHAPAVMATYLRSRFFPEDPAMEDSAVFAGLAQVKAASSAPATVATRRSA